MNRNDAAVLSYNFAMNSDLSNICQPLQTQHTDTQQVCSSEPPQPKKIRSLDSSSSTTEQIDISFLRTLLDDASVTSDYRLLIRKIGATLSNSDSLYESFVTEGVEGPVIKRDELLEMYNLLISTPELYDPVVVATENLVANLKREALARSDPKHVQLVLIMLLNPILLDTDKNHSIIKSILAPLCGTIHLLPEPSKQYLIDYWARLPQEQFKEVLVVLQQFLTFRSILVENYLNTDEPIISAVRALDLLYKANLRRKPSHEIVDESKFCNELVNDKIDFKADVHYWKEKKGFSFCLFPFLFNSQAKSLIMRYESISQMRAQREMTGFFSIPYLYLKVHRSNLIADTLNQLTRYDDKYYKMELRVHFIGEEAVDEGGVKKEFFQLIIRHIFDAIYGMFIHDSETRLYWFNHSSTEMDEFALIGKILGMAIYNGVILDVHFPSVIYKKLIGEKPTFEDLKESHPSLANGLQKLLDYTGEDIEEVFGSSFQIQYDNFGASTSFDLLPNGAHIPVNQKNKKEFVEMYTKFLLEDLIEKQFEAFKQGFEFVCASDALKLFTAKDLQLVICGSPILNFEELQKNTRYDNGYSPDHPVIKNFWEVVHSFSLEQQKRLLFFSTGSDRAPIGGLGNLNFVITRHGTDSDRLPQAHTCFNHLLLPEYATKEKLRDRLEAAINNSEGFGML
eukprot:TRINITY_DN4826_c0_g1_i1.p1 TRINITY_DN4826_c0_g1~~TRINITY_DN4826_c0_g1_i1.p1  ORF type:complete len:739 (-),score=109.74 TRINITY_DN4826_c0_g1_i1:90-2132(-)